jgi:hypothetical protein
VAAVKSEEIIRYLKDHQDATVRISIAGEPPVTVRAIAYIDDNIVLMAVPGWQFSELDEAMASLGAAVGTASSPDDLLNVGWQQFWKRSLTNGKEHWACKAHGTHSSEPNCQECRDKTPFGWHNGVGNGAWFCNTHSKGACPDCGTPKTAGKATSG